MYPYFKKWVSTVDYMYLSMVASQFLPGNVSNQGKNSSRAVSPSSGKSGLSSTVTNKVNNVAFILLEHSRKIFYYIFYFSVWGQCRIQYSLPR